MPSFITNFHELDCTFAFVTETWFTEGARLDTEAEKLLLGSGLSIFTRSRPPGNAGFSHGGVAIITRDISTSFKEITFPNPDEYEVLVIVGHIAKVLRKVVLVVAYMPPNYAVPRAKECFKYINGLFHEIKRSHHGALICLGGDFNQWDINDAVLDFPEIVEVMTGPTRNERRIDRLFLNWPEAVVDHSVLNPLDAENASGERLSTSDHKVQFVSSVLQMKEPVVWEEFTFRPYNETAAENFREEMKNTDWSDVISAIGSNDKARVFQSILDDMMNRHFPWKTVKKKSSDLPWFNQTAKKKVRKKKAVFRDEGKSDRWKALAADLEEYLSKRREVFLQKQRNNLTGPDANRQFFKNVSSYKSFDKPRSFSVRDLRPGKEDGEVAEEVAEYFNKISGEFQPLEPDQIPSTYDRDIPLLTPADVETRLKKCKKPNSMVVGDLFPKLVSPCSPFLAIPLANIYNCILTTYVWPKEWKGEYVTTIPKKKLPSSFGDLRNISCTLLFSKLFEAYVLQCALEELTLKGNQYGGVKGCSTTHMLVEIVQQICDNAEDYRAATVISAIDYSKAFNRVSYQHCLRAFKKKHASTPILKLIATFLTNRTMTVKVGKEWSEPREVNGGCPQGSILGVFLFNVTTEDLEEGFEKHEQERLGARQAAALPDPVVDETGEVENGDELSQPVTSSPIAPRRPAFPPLSPLGRGIFRMAGARRVLLGSNVRNAPRLITPPIERKVGTQVLTRKPVLVYKYVDDNITVEKLNFGNDPVIDGEASGRYKKKMAVSSQNAFVCITTAALEKGMLVNESKTQLLCVSDSINFKTLAYIKTPAGETIECKDSMKVLGFHFSDRTGVSKHVVETIKKVRQKYWVLYHLRKLGFSEEELVMVYKSNLLPVFDYCCPVYHSLLTDIQDQALEAAQVGALRGIFGYGLSARKLREKAGISTLRQRRIELTDKFAVKCAASERFAAWFPIREGRSSGRNAGLKYREDFAKCDRLRNSPLFYMRRRLNGKEGKAYGQRNKVYRE